MAATKCRAGLPCIDGLASVAANVGKRHLAKSSRLQENLTGMRKIDHTYYECGFDKSRRKMCCRKVTIGAYNRLVLSKIDCLSEDADCFLCCFKNWYACFGFIGIDTPSCKLDLKK